MSTVTSQEGERSEVRSTYFERTPTKEWNAVNALAYFIEQGVSVENSYDMVDNGIKTALKSRKVSKKILDELYHELNLIKAINQMSSPSSTSSSPVKLADVINNFGNVHQNNNIFNQQKKRKDNDTSKENTLRDEPLTIKKTKKTFSFSKPLTGPLLTINKPRINEIDAHKIKSTFEICITSVPSTPSSQLIESEYEQNMADQHTNTCLQKIPNVQLFLEDLIYGDYDQLLDKIYVHKINEHYTPIEEKYTQLLKYTMIDYHANCEKPTYYTESNERTPYCEHVIPVFKYFSAVFKNISFMWCEKGLEANKQLVICLDDNQKKMMDGVGFSVVDKAERLIIECSGERDGVHTEEDTLKLMEATSRCLKSEMMQYQSASWNTFGNRKVLALQSINNTVTLLSTKRVDGSKWAFIEQRSALIPRDWNDRLYWIKVFELLVKLNSLLNEQEKVTEQLKKEQVGLIQVDVNDNIKQALINF